MKKKRLLIPLLISFMWINIFAGNSLIFSERVRDLGKIGQHKRFVWIVKVKNTSDKAITFTKIKTTCGCTYAKPEKKTILPGEEIKFKIIFNSEAFEGRIEKLVFIDTSTKERYVLRLKAFVEKDIYLEPDRIKISTKDDYLEQLIEVKTPVEEKKIEIRKIILPEESGIKARKVDKKSFVLEINPAKIKKAGTEFVKVYVKGKETPYSLAIEVEKPKYYRFSPSDTLLFLNIKKGQKIEKSIIVFSKEKFNIISRETGLSFLKVKNMKKLSDKEWKITFLFDTEKIGNKKTGKKRIKIKTDNAKAPFIEVNLVYHLIK